MSSIGRAELEFADDGTPMALLSRDGLGSRFAIAEGAGMPRPGSAVDVFADLDVPLQPGCLARPVTFVFIDFDNGNDNNAGTRAAPKKTADVASWGGGKTSWFSNEALAFRAGSFTRLVTERVEVAPGVFEVQSVRCGMEHLSSGAAASIGLTTRKHLCAYWEPGDDPTVRPVFRSLNNGGSAGSAQRCVAGTSGTVTNVSVSDIIFDGRDVANRNGLAFGEFGDGQTITNVTVANCVSIGGTINDGNSYAGLKFQIFGQYARTAAYLVSKGVLVVNHLSLGCPGHGIAVNGTWGEQLANGRWHGVDLVSCLAFACGRDYDTHGFTAYSGGVNLNWAGAWTLVSGTIYSRNMATQYGRNVPDIAICHYDTGNGTERFQLVRNTATPTTPADGEYGFDSGTQLLYVNYNTAVLGTHRFTTVVRPVRGMRRIMCRAVGTRRPVPSVTGALEGHGFAFDDGTSDCTDIWCESIANQGHGWTFNLGNNNRLVGPIAEANVNAVIKGNFGWLHSVSRGKLVALGYSDTVPGVKAAIHFAHASRRNLNTATGGDLLGSTLVGCELSYVGSDAGVALLAANTSGNCPVVEASMCKLSPGVGLLEAGNRTWIAGRVASVPKQPPSAAGLGT